MYRVFLYFSSILDTKYNLLVRNGSFKAASHNLSSFKATLSNFQSVVPKVGVRGSRGTELGFPKGDFKK